ncbi:type II toxin-antitoxin system VapC family toxin [Nitrosococcus watsonii]|uniref:PilT protein domain protein n=1 Tax=Nitrosococcus watsoni (strain C-113) TaxID=105559 RepID=D8KAN5_NITWC|nr:PIN domain nuclease [Nitrosococcus watsonii]ADJ29462.1 PilT protein domain protein [Nitrosococcus watsonii C-113]
MILADTGVWIDYFNGAVNEKTDLLDFALDEGTIAMGDLILLEILQGFREDSEYNKAKRTLTTLDQYELFGRHMVDKCADNYRFLRKKGITIRKTADLIIATFCIDNRFQLLFSDKDFAPFADYLNLEQFQPKT